jgi:hypothetical protein
MTVLKLRTGVCIAAAILMGLGVARAQSGQADVQGIVADATGSVVVGSQVVLTNTESGVKRSVVTSSDGRYSFPTIAPGHYSITATAATFSPETITGLEIQLDNHVNQNFTLHIGGDSQAITVTGDVPAVDTTAYDVGGVITQAQIDSLPISNRQYLNLALLIPGTTQDASRNFYNSVQAGGGNLFFANGFYLDGVTNQQTEEGDPRQNIPEGAVSEFKTYTSSFPAELGWAMGGFTTVVTKSGTNQIHGEAFEYFRQQWLDQDNQFQKATSAAQGTGKAPYLRNQYGFDMGGPIFKNRTHYYGAFERTQQNVPYTLYVAPVVQQFYSANLGTFPSLNHDQMLTLRLDHDITATQQLFVRYAQEWNLESNNGCSGSNTYGCYTGQIPRHAIVVGHTWEPTAKIVNDARFQYAYISYELGPYGTPIPSKPSDLVNPSYTQNIGVGYRFPSFTYGKEYAAVGVESRWEVNDSLTIQHNTHSFKMGFDVSYVPYVDANATNLNGTYYFNTDTQVFNPANTSNLTSPYLFTQAAVPLIFYLPSTQTSYFFQDTWKLRPNLTANLGIRYDRQYGSAFLDTYTPDTTNHPAIPFEGDPHKRGDRNNFGPRIGISWDPRGKGKDVIRAGYGVYYNFIQTELMEAEKLNFVACPIQIANPVFGNPYNGQSVSKFCSTAPPAVSTISPSLSNPYEQQFSLGYTRQLSNDLSFSADGIYDHGLRDFKPYDRNYPVGYDQYFKDGASVAPTGVPRPFTNFNNITQNASEDQSKYKALYLKIDKRLSHRYMYGVYYALSSGTDRNPQTAPNNYSALSNDFGPANYDRRHAIVANGSAMLPFKILLGVIYTYRSSEPFSASVAQTNFNGIAYYVPGSSRNQGNRGINWADVNTYRQQYAAAKGVNLSTNLNHDSVVSSQFNDLDVRVSKVVFQHDAMKLEVIGQAFNLLGIENYSSFNFNANTAAFGSATAATTNQTNQLQQGELAAKFTF